MRTQHKDLIFVQLVMQSAMLGMHGHIDQGHLEDVRTRRAERIELVIAAQHPRLRAHAHVCLGLVRLAQDDAAGARRHFEAALTMDGIARPDPVALGGLAFLALRSRSFVRALKLQGAASSMPEASCRSVIGPTARVGPWLEAGIDPTDLERLLWIGAARRALGRDAAEAAWREGAAMSAAHAVAYAHSDVGDRPAQGGPLTGREKQIAALVAGGHRNREIAERLTISRRTVDAHVEHIRNKLGHQSKVQVAAWATEHGLVTS